MKKNLDLIIFILFGISLFSEVFVGIYLFLIFFPITVVAKCSNLLGMAIIILAILKMLSRYFKNKSDEEPEDEEE
jgi:putative Mn2+ efflux pump MntP